MISVVDLGSSWRDVGWDGDTLVVASRPPIRLPPTAITCSRSRRRCARAGWKTFRLETNVGDRAAMDHRLAEREGPAARWRNSASRRPRRGRAETLPALAGEQRDLERISQSASTPCKGAVRLPRDCLRTLDISSGEREGRQGSAAFHDLLLTSAPLGMRGGLYARREAPLSKRVDARRQADFTFQPRPVPDLSARSIRNASRDRVAPIRLPGTGLDEWRSGRWASNGRGRRRFYNSLSN